MKRVIKTGLLVLLLFVININNVFADNMGELEFCKSNEVLKVFRLIAVLITIIKIVIPVIIIIKGILLIFNATISDDDNALSKNIGMLARKILVGIFIFFVPSIVYAMASLVGEYDKTSSKFTECTKCMNSIKYCNSVIKK